MEGDTMKNTSIENIRSFNRFYTKHLGLFNKEILNTSCTLTESRILYEINERKNGIANEIANDLNIDRSYMSRILTKFIKSGWLIKTASSSDSRRQILTLTVKGQEILDEVNKQSDNQIQELLSDLSKEDIALIEKSMQIIQDKMGRNLKLRDQ